MLLFMKGVMDKMTNSRQCRIKNFINDVLGISLVITPFSAERLPFVLKDQYDFFVAVLNNYQFLFLFNKGGQMPTPAAIRKHCDMLKDYFEYDVVYAADEMTSYDRKRLLEQRVAFVVPQRQLYIPVLGIAFKEIFGTRQEKKAVLGTCAQLIVLSFLHHKLPFPMRLSDVTKLFGYSKMSACRAFDELEAFGLAASTLAQRERALKFMKHGRKLWTAALPFLASPVKKEIELTSFPPELEKCRAGLTALTESTMLAAPRQRVAAITLSTWNNFCKTSGGNTYVVSHGGEVKLQLWRYSPSLFGENDSTDKLSLFLSLRSDHDERVKMALEDMLKEFVW